MRTRPFFISRAGFLISPWPTFQDAALGLHVPLPRLMGTMPRESRDRAACVRFDASGSLLAAQGADKILDVRICGGLVLSLSFR
jgi:hypothetical protein